MPCSFFLRLWMLFVIINAHIILQNRRVGTLRFHLDHSWRGNECLFTLVAITTKDISSVLEVLPNYIDIPRTFFQQANQASLCLIFSWNPRSSSSNALLSFPKKQASGNTLLFYQRFLLCLPFYIKLYEKLIL